jgi:integrase
MTTPTPRRSILSDRTIAARAKRPGTILRDSEVPRLEFRVRDGGAASWSIRYRFRGKFKRFTIGQYPEMVLAEARKRATAALLALNDGIDPTVAKQERIKADTVAELAQTYIEKHAKAKKRSWKVDEWMLNRDVLPLWKDRLARDITRRDVRELVEAIAERGTPILANRVTALLSKLFKFACSRDMIDASPVVGVERPGTEQQRDRVLTDDELRQFWTATETLDAQMRAFWRLRLLTAQRGIEVNTMRWADVDLDGGWWTIPATTAKNKLSHRVPLSQPVIDLLKQLPRDTEFALDGARGKRQQREAAATFNIKDFKGHDLRRTAATKMASAGIARLVVGKVLNHVEPGVTKVYDRHGYDAEKRVALDTWARTLTGILEAKPADVLPFTKKDDPAVFTPDASITNADWPKHGAPDVDANGKRVRARVRR